MAQMGIVGPLIGQYHYFYHFNKGLSEIGEKRYFEITKSIYKVLDERLANNKFLLEKIIQLQILQHGHG